MSKLFDELNLSSALVEALKKENITVPTDIQEKFIPEAIKNKDLIAQSETGTGKTLAYLLPLYEKLNADLREMQAMILVPTHELAIQVLRQIERLSANSGIKLTSTPVMGNVNIERQIEKLKERPNIIVGSPGRILELIKKKKISAHTIKTIIIDEADKLLDINNIDTVKAVIKSTLKERQLMILSATITEATINIAKEIMKEPEIIKAEAAASVPSNIDHIYFVAEQRDKVDVVRKLVRIINPQKAIVFVNNSVDIDITAEKLKYHGLKAEGLSGASFKLDRKKALNDFREGKLQLLVASDIAARGLHIEGVTHIFNMSMPEEPKDYLHRSGRSGRNGNAGLSISIITERELPLIKAYEKSFGIKITEKFMYEGKISDSKKPNTNGRPRSKQPQNDPKTQKSKHVTVKTNKAQESRKTTKSASVSEHLSESFTEHKSGPSSGFDKPHNTKQFQSRNKTNGVTRKFRPAPAKKS